MPAVTAGKGASPWISHRPLLRESGRGTFAKDRLPPKELWPRLHFDLPELRYPDRLNCATVLLDDAVAEGHGNRPGSSRTKAVITYRELLDRANRIANVLTGAGVVPGNRVLLRGYNGRSSMPPGSP